MGQTLCQDDIIIHPRRESGEKQLPKGGFFLPNPSEARFSLAEVTSRGGKKRSLFHSSLCVSNDDEFFIAGPGVGAPMAVLCLEKLIALGAEKIILLSCCGSLEPNLCVGDMILPDRAISGEGTSQYYRSSKQLVPDQTISRELERFLFKEKFDFHRGTIWSTDAPYRESRRELENLRNRSKVSGVDMEFAALCSVARFRKVSLAALFIVSDLLFTNPWQSGFNQKQFRNRSKTLIQKILFGGHRLFHCV